ncbi:hypothetical protein [Paenibacillus contaminans]|jgi:hypothetical protein|uniref:Uncharacterized protein n=1 Tax=Paenibacillus contaminans TaxID=450362 RepID=A0A329MMK2_9BACL|nr:hypothetical protein [Paenibacillus contaminans]RAV21171.1 hypothetical protein DQG23_10935 [Paenibacillus contaminans]
MNTQVHIPQDEQMITVKLSIKEAIALSGVRFNQQPSLAVDARKKLRKALEHEMLPESDKIHYHALDM